MALVLYNTLSNKKENFKTIEEGKVKMYVCGPTVYNFLHIGNFRGPIFYNLLRNWLEDSGYLVTYVFNYTDVDDKIIQSAKENGVTQSEHASQYIKEFEKDFQRLELKKHEHNPRVTDHIEDIINLISKLIKNEKAYVIDGEVFYQTSLFKDYGKLSGKKIEELEAGRRVDVDHRKRHPSDFVLWKPAKKGEPFWKSPWSEGRPGWHIECSAMIHALLGNQIDIHGGGIDLIFPHHENEIAQGEGANSTQYCNYWVHNEFINIDNEKMSKSLGNFITGRDFMDKYHPEVLKFVFLSAHYRSVLNINDDKIHSSFGGLDRVYKALSDADYISKNINDSQKNQGKERTINNKFQEVISNATIKIKKAYDDDLNTPEVFAQIFTVIRSFNELNLLKKLKDNNSKIIADLFILWIKDQGKLLSLFCIDPNEFLITLDDIALDIKKLKRDTVDQLVVQREKSRALKDFKKSDELRDQLNDLGILISDGLIGPRWSVDKSKF